jgi:hypothetical protein
LLQAFPLGQDPIIIATGEQFAAIQLHRRAQCRRGTGVLYRLFKFCDVKRKRSIGLLLHGLRVRKQKTICARQCFAEVGTGLRFGGIGIEEICEPLAGLGHSRYRTR